nr:DUF6600 domain-containing protein [Flavobacterium sp. ASV13]
MKTIRKSATKLLFLATFLVGLNTNKIYAQDNVSAVITYQDFYDSLSPYGTWIEYSGYGHVWRPRLEENFRPYVTNGYWNYCDDGWMWYSNYDWGWAPFHYGRWINDTIYGWLWIPGYEWSPAWVTWGYVDNYYAWAPLPPNINAGIRYNSWRPRPNDWNFARREYINDRNIGSRIENNTINNRFSSQINVVNNFSTTKNNNYYYSKGPELNDVQKYTKQTIQPVTVHPVNRISDTKAVGNEVHVFKPDVVYPQPKEFRRMDNPEMTNNNFDRESTNSSFDQQRQHVENLPVYRAPESSFRREEGGGGGGRRR